MTVLNRQRGVSVNLTYLRDAARVALRLCAPLRGGGAPVLMSLEEVVVTCVSDKRIDRVHRDFMAVAGATDVITFEHGDILISADTADREARAGAGGGGGRGAGGVARARRGARPGAGRLAPKASGC